MTTVQGGPSASTFVLARAWRSYLGSLDSSPVMTKAVSAGVLSVVSDLVAKGAARAPVKSSSLINELTMGLVIRGPIIHYFHTFLDKVVFKRANQSSTPVILGKLAIDQFLFAPLFTALYFYVIGLMEDQPVADTTRKVRSMLLSVMKSNWSVWIPANLIGYSVIPLNLRVLFGNVVSIFWTAFLIRKVRPARTNSLPDTPATSS